MMLKAIIWLAIACGALSALTGNRTAWVLLASVGVCFWMHGQNVPFSFPLWLMIDLAVILAMFLFPRDLTKADCVILALFLPAWVFYLMPPAERELGSAVVVVAQLFLTFPLEQAQRCLRRLHKPRDPDRFDRMAIA